MHKTGKERAWISCWCKWRKQHEYFRSKNYTFYHADIFDMSDQFWIWSPPNTPCMILQELKNGKQWTQRSGFSFPCAVSDPKVKKPRNPVCVLLRSLGREAGGRGKMWIPGGAACFYIIASFWSKTRSRTALQQKFFPNFPLIFKQFWVQLGIHSKTRNGHVAKDYKNDQCKCHYPLFYNKWAC